MSNLYSFTLRVTDAEGRVATLADSITVSDVPTTEVVTLSSRTINATGETVQGSPRTITASLTLASNGRLSTSDGVTSSTEWGISTTGSDYEARFTPAGGAAFDGAATAAWVSLGSDRTWSESLTTTAANGQPVTQVTSGVLEIRDVATSTIRATATITFNLVVTVVASSVRLTDQTFNTTGISLDPSPAYNFNFVSFGSDGRLQAYQDSFLITVPNEWGPGQNSAAHEVRFTLLSLHPQHRVMAGTVFGTWQNLAFSAGYGLDMEFTSVGEYDTESTVLVEIRPIGGAVIASATHTISMDGYRYPTGIIP